MDGDFHGLVAEGIGPAALVGDHRDVGFVGRSSQRTLGRNGIKNDFNPEGFSK